MDTMNSPVMKDFSSQEITENNSSENCGIVLQNKFITLETVPSRYGPYNTLRGTVGKSGAVVLVVQGKKALLVCQPRYAVGLKMWELPRGGASENEEPLDAAWREVKEETDVDVNPEDIVCLGPIYPDTGILQSFVNLFFVRLSEDLGDISISSPDGEVDHVAWVDIDDLVEACIDSSIADSFTIATVLKAKVAGHI